MKYWLRMNWKHLDITRKIVSRDHRQLVHDGIDLVLHQLIEQLR